MGARGIGLVSMVALVACAAAGPAEAADPRTVVTLTFDDGQANQQDAVDILDELGLRGTFFLVSGYLDRSNRLTTEQALAIRAAGHEIGGHTLHHARLTELDDEQAALEVCADRDALAAAGLGPIVSFAFPFSASDPRTSAIVEGCGYRWGRSQGGIDKAGCTGDCVYAESFTPENAFELRGPSSVKADWTLADLQGYVLRAEQGGGGVVTFTFHHVCDTCDELYKITPSLFREFVTWVAAREDRGTVVLPLAEALAGDEPDTTPPSVVLTSPAPGARLAGDVELAAHAEDDTGIAEVAFFVDGHLVGAAAVPPYSVTWHATPTKGPVAIVAARAMDFAGNVVVSQEGAVVIEGAGSPSDVNTTEPIEPTRFRKLRWAPHVPQVLDDDEPAGRRGGASTGCAQAGSPATDAWGLAIVALVALRRRQRGRR